MTDAGAGAPAEKPPVPEDDAPVGFWSELTASVRKELGPPASGFFTSSDHAPVRGRLKGSRLDLECSVSFVAETLDKPAILEVVSRKASAQLGRPINAFVVDLSTRAAENPRMEQLLNFGKAHSDVIKIR